jgi:hypothetical protein
MEVSYSLTKEQPEQPGNITSPIESPSPSPEEPKTYVNPQVLLGMMNVHHLKAIDDEQLIIRRGNSMDSEATSHAATMFQTPQIQNLLKSAGSGVVLVNGCTDRSQNTKISPLTYVCANLTHTLRNSTATKVVLAFFCGQHTSSQDDLIGPQGLMRSLVADLILSLTRIGCGLEVAPSWFPDSQENGEQLSFPDTCQLFYHLVELVPKATRIYCVVDGISYYERQDLKEDYDLMMKCFDSIILNDTVAADFKLLLTTPSVSRWLSGLPESKQISLRNMRTKSNRPGNFIPMNFE